MVAYPGMTDRECFRQFTSLFGLEGDYDRNLTLEENAINLIDELDPGTKSAIVAYLKKEEPLNLSDEDLYLWWRSHTPQLVISGNGVRAILECLKEEL